MFQSFSLQNLNELFIHDSCNINSHLLIVDFCCHCSFVNPDNRSSMIGRINLNDGASTLSRERWHLVKKLTFFLLETNNLSWLCKAPLIDCLLPIIIELIVVLPRVSVDGNPFVVGFLQVGIKVGERNKVLFSFVGFGQFQKSIVKFSLSVFLMLGRIVDDFAGIGVLEMSPLAWIEPEVEVSTFGIAAPHVVSHCQDQIRRN